MSYRSYLPRRGDLVHMNFSPSVGHEMADRHYALVISASAYNAKSRMAVVCPITSRVRGWPYEVVLPPDLLPWKGGRPVSSVIVADAVRGIDYREREMQFVAKAPRDVLEDVLDKLFTLLDEPAG